MAMSNDRICDKKTTISIIIPNHERDITELLESVGKEYEVIVVNDNDLCLAEKRNYGVYKSTGNYLLFIDDDNIVGKFSINNLLEVFKDERVGIAGMVGMYSGKQTGEWNKVCDSGATRNLLTGFTHDKYVNQEIFDIWAWEGIIPYEVDEVSNVFMVKREVFDKIGLFDQDNFPIDLDEADFCLRAKKAGYRVVVAPNAFTCHNTKRIGLPNFKRPKNAYYMGRNKILFQRKHNLSLSFVPIFIIVYILCLLRNPRMIIHFIRGVYAGLRNNTKSPQRYSV
uniref:Putative glycosyltransferase n=1 Tax=viral metagenome TaxID=1070528 RepID=A0A6M3JWS5_9ZZZZ